MTPRSEGFCANIGGDNPPVTPESEGFCANISGDSGSGGESGGDGGSCGGDGDGGSGGDEGFCTGEADGIYSNPKDTTKFQPVCWRQDLPLPVCSGSGVPPELQVL